jgi:adiponectin receptor
MAKTEKKVKPKSTTKDAPEADSSNEFIGTIHNAMRWNIDNVYIMRGYRMNFTTIKQIWRSLFMIHNESVNIWSHLLGALFFLLLLYHVIMNADTIRYSTGIEGLNAYNSTAIRDAFEIKYEKAVSLLEEVTHYDLRNELSAGINTLRNKISEDLHLLTADEIMH